MKPSKTSERGQALVIIALAMIGLIALTALAIDGGNVYSDRRNAQNAADTAVMASALNYVRSNSWSNAKAAGLARAASNGYVDNDASETSTSPNTNVEIYNPPISGPYSDCTSTDFNCLEYVQVIITHQVSTYFAPIVGITQLTNKVNAVARVQPTFPNPYLPGNAIVSTNEHDCPAATVGGNAVVELIDGGVFVNSDCANNTNKDAFEFNGLGGLTAPSLCTVGPNSVVNNGTTVVIGNIDEDCNPAPPFTDPDPTCTGTAIVDPNNSTVMLPGTYSGNKFPPAGVTTLTSGIYCITNGDFDHENGILTGIGVVIRVDTGEVRINGGTVTLEAPSEGKYENLLIFLPQENNSGITINGNNNMTFKGTILGQSSHAIINGTSDSEGMLSSQIITNTIDISGGGEGFITYNPDNSWIPQYPPQISSIE